MEPSKSIPPEGGQPPKKSTAAQIVYAVIIGFITFYIVSMMLDDGSSSPSRAAETRSEPAEVATSKPTPAPQQDMLELVSQNCTGEYGYAIVSGQVKNISDTSLENVEVVAVALTEDGTQITSDSALIEYNPILPGQTSPFKAHMTYNPAMAKCGVLSFKELMGGTIQTKFK